MEDEGPSRCPTGEGLAGEAEARRGVSRAVSLTRRISLLILAPGGSGEGVPRTDGAIRFARLDTALCAANY